MSEKVKIGDHVVIVEGSSDGYNGVVIEIKPKGRVRVKREDGVEVDVPHGSYYIK